jgi:hypothetical protein
MLEIVQKAHKTKKNLKNFIFKFFQNFPKILLLRAYQFTAFFIFGNIWQFSTLFQRSPQVMHSILGECHILSLPEAASISPACWLPRCLQQPASGVLGVWPTVSLPVSVSDLRGICRTWAYHTAHQRHCQARTAFDRCTVHQNQTDRDRMCKVSGNENFERNVETFENFRKSKYPGHCKKTHETKKNCKN